PSDAFLNFCLQCCDSLSCRPSFPTRRSSDLADRQNEEMGDGKCSGLLWKRQWEFPNENDGRVHKNGERAVLKFAGEFQYGTFSIDRKSTRLNSSHVKTSYAVFCLKKNKGLST